MACENHEAAFRESWALMIRFYERDFLPDERWQWLTPMRDLIVRMRDAGYDRTLRAGQSLYRFIVARSRDHGLRDDQPSLMFDPRKDDVLVHASGFARDRRFAVPYGDLDPQLEELLDALVTMPITWKSSRRPVQGRRARSCVGGRARSPIRSALTAISIRSSRSSSMRSSICRSREHMPTT